MHHVFVLIWPCALLICAPAAIEGLNILCDDWTTQNHTDIDNLQLTSCDTATIAKLEGRINNQINDLTIKDGDIPHMMTEYLTGFKELQTLHLMNNKIKKCNADFFERIATLNTLDVHERELILEDRNSFPPNSTIEFITFEINSMSPKIFNSLPHHLKQLSVSKTIIQQNGKVEISTDYLKLESLTLNNCSLRVFKITASFPDLIVLNLENNNLQSIDDINFASFTKLQKLFLESNKINQMNFDLFQKSPNLLLVNLKNNKPLHQLSGNHSQTSLEIQLDNHRLDCPTITKFKANLANIDERICKEWKNEKLWSIVFITVLTIIIIIFIVAIFIYILRKRNASRSINNPGVKSESPKQLYGNPIEFKYPEVDDELCQFPIRQRPAQKFPNQVDDYDDYRIPGAPRPVQIIADPDDDSDDYRIPGASRPVQNFPHQDDDSDDYRVPGASRPVQNYAHQADDSEDYCIPGASRPVGKSVNMYDTRL